MAVAGLSAMLALSLSTRAVAQTPAATADGIPPRPELLRFADVPFQIPDASSYRRRLDAAPTANAGDSEAGARDPLPIFVVEDHTVPLFELTLALPIGDVLDPPDRLGTASLTATLLRSGGAGERTAEELDEEIDYLGIDLSVIGGSLRSGITLDGSPRALEAALDLLADVLLRPRFQADRLAVLKRNLEASMRSRNDAPGAIAGREWGWLLWGRDHPLAGQVLPAHLAAIDREAIVEFHRRHWRSSGAVLAISGDVDADAVIDLVSRKLGDWIRASPPRGDSAPSPPAGGSTLPRPDRAPPGLYWRELDSPQVEILLGHAGYLRSGWDDRDAFALLVMSEIFDGPGAISRLRSRLRAQESLVYDASAGYGIGSVQEGLFEIRLATSPENAPRALALVIEELSRMRTQLPHPRELELAKRIHLDAFPLLFDSAEKIGGRFAEDVLLGRPHAYWTTYRDRVASVTLEQVLGAAQRTLHPDQLRVLWVGPPPPEAELRQLGFRNFVRLPERDPFTLEVAGEPGTP